MDRGLKGKHSIVTDGSLGVGKGRRVGLRIVCFEAYSAFTHVTACTLALSPYFVTRLTEGFNHFVTSVVAPVASGWSGCRVGFTPTGKAPPFHGAHPQATLVTTLIEWLLSPPLQTAVLVRPA